MIDGLEVAECLFKAEVVEVDDQVNGSTAALGGVPVDELLSVNR